MDAHVKDKIVLIGLLAALTWFLVGAFCFSTYRKHDEGVGGAQHSANEPADYDAEERPAGRPTTPELEAQLLKLLPGPPRPVRRPLMVGSDGYATIFGHNQLTAPPSSEKARGKRRAMHTSDPSIENPFSAERMANPSFRTANRYQPRSVAAHIREGLTEKEHARAAILNAITTSKGIAAENAAVLEPAVSPETDDLSQDLGNNETAQATVLDAHGSDQVFASKTVRFAEPAVTEDDERQMAEREKTQQRDAERRDAERREEERKEEQRREEKRKEEQRLESERKEAQRVASEQASIERERAMQQNTTDQEMEDQKEGSEKAHKSSALAGSRLRDGSHICRKSGPRDPLTRTHRHTPSERSPRLESACRIFQRHRQDWSSRFTIIRKRRYQSNLTRRRRYHRTVQDVEEMKSLLSAFKRLKLDGSGDYKEFIMPMQVTTATGCSFIPQQTALNSKVREDCRMSDQPHPPQQPLPLEHGPVQTAMTLVSPPPVNAGIGDREDSTMRDQPRPWDQSRKPSSGPPRIASASIQLATNSSTWQTSASSNPVAPSIVFSSGGTPQNNANPSQGFTSGPPAWFAPSTGTQNSASVRTAVPYKPMIKRVRLQSDRPGSSVRSAAVGTLPPVAAPVLSSFGSDASPSQLPDVAPAAAFPGSVKPLIQPHMKGATPDGNPNATTPALSQKQPQQTDTRTPAVTPKTAVAKHRLNENNQATAKLVFDQFQKNWTKQNTKAPADLVTEFNRGTLPLNDIIRELEESASWSDTNGAPAVFNANAIGGDLHECLISLASRFDFCRQLPNGTAFERAYTAAVSCRRRLDNASSGTSTSQAQQPPSSGASDPAPVTAQDPTGMAWPNAAVGSDQGINLAADSANTVVTPNPLLADDLTARGAKALCFKWVGIWGNYRLERLQADQWRQINVSDTKFLDKVARMTEHMSWLNASNVPEEHSPFYPEAKEKVFGKMLKKLVPSLHRACSEHPACVELQQLSTLATACKARLDALPDAVLP